MDPQIRDRWLAEAHERVTAAGLRAGRARTAVIELLAREGQCLLSALEISQRLRASGAGSTASVYRVVDELAELGLLHRMDGRDGVARYEIADPDHHHHHLVDERTGDITAFADDELEAVIERVAVRLGVRLTSHDVVLRGERDRG